MIVNPGDNILVNEPIYSGTIHAVSTRLQKATLFLVTNKKLLHLENSLSTET